MRTREALLFLPGLYFGFVLSRAGASDFRFIHDFFAGRDFSLGLLMLAAAVTAHLGMRLLMLRGRAVSGEPVRVSRKRPGRFGLAGAALFGLGWGISGACPGTVLVQAGEGRLPALFTLAGLLAGTWLYAVTAERRASGH